MVESSALFKYFKSNEIYSTHPNSSQVSYLGFIEVDFNDENTGVRKTCETILALLTPSSSNKDKEPLLVGTNTQLVRDMAKHCYQLRGNQFAKKFYVSMYTSLCF